MNASYKLFKQLEPHSTSKQMDAYHHRVKEELIRKLEDSYQIFAMPEHIITYQKEDLFMMHADEIVQLEELYQTCHQLQVELQNCLDHEKVIDIDAIKRLAKNGKYDGTNQAVMARILDTVLQSGTYQHPVITNITSPWDIIHPSINEWYTPKSLYHTIDLAEVPSSTTMEQRLTARPLHYFGYRKLETDNKVYVAKQKLKASRRYHMIQFSAYGLTMIASTVLFLLLRQWYPDILEYIINNTFMTGVYIAVLSILAIGVGWISVLLYTNKKYPFPYYRSMSFVFIATIYVIQVIGLRIFEHSWSMIVTSFTYLLVIASRYLRDYMIASSRRHYFNGHMEWGYTTLLVFLAILMSIVGYLLFTGWNGLFLLTYLLVYGVITVLGLGELREEVLG
jgi:hypothetical protein